MSHKGALEALDRTLQDLLWYLNCRKLSTNVAGLSKRNTCWWTQCIFEVFLIVATCKISVLANKYEKLPAKWCFSYSVFEFGAENWRVKFPVDQNGQVTLPEGCCSNHGGVQAQGLSQHWSFLHFICFRMYLASKTRWKDCHKWIRGRSPLTSIIINKIFSMKLKSFA